MRKIRLDQIEGFETLSTIPTLPTPQIAKRRTYLRDRDGRNTREVFNSISTRNTSGPDLEKILFPEEYYFEQFDIYFNSFGTMNWLNLPDKQVELCMVSSKSYKVGASRETNLNLSGKGNKDDFTKAIVHPANSGYDRNNITNTIFSGGAAGGAGISRGITQTEWKLNENDLSFGENINGNGLNRLNNPNITIQIDVRDFFQGMSVPLVYPSSFVEGYRIKVKHIGDIKFNKRTNRVYKRNSILFFRLSAGIPESYNPKTKTYKKRIFSDLSQPIYITPKIGNFPNDIKDYSQGYQPYIFGHLVKIGSK